MVVKINTWSLVVFLVPPLRLLMYRNACRSYSAGVCGIVLSFKCHPRFYEPLYDSYAKLDFARGADGINGPLTVALKSSED